jgi:uncharacterized protein (TIGR00297 family)
MQLLLGFLLATIIAYAAYRARSLNKSGAIAATFTGTIIFGVGGWAWAILLLTFFITSSGLSRAFKKQKKNLDEKFSKGHERDAGQVFGNGGVATFFAALSYFSPDSILPWVGFAAALAAVNADTWATELGVLNPHPPRMITNPAKVVEKGTSGGVSLYGTLASLAGAGLIGVLAAILMPVDLQVTSYRLQAAGSSFSILHSAFIITLAGLAGSLFDSLLGATVQAMYFCPKDNKETEKHPLHTCGAETVHIRGWKWLENDWVNFACGAFGAVVAVAFFI